jgi:hypothetical protein
MSKKKKLPIKRNPNAKALEEPLFRQRVRPSTDREAAKAPKADEWEN